MTAAAHAPTVAIVAGETAFTDVILKSVYRNGQLVWP